MIDFEAIAEQIFQAAVQGLGEGAQIVESRAKHLAPVRHIFAEDHYTIRHKKAHEIEVDRAIRARLGLSVEGSLDNPTPKTIRAKSPLRRTNPGSRWAGTYGSRPTPKWRERRAGVAYGLLSDYDAEMRSRKLDNDPQPTVLDRRGAYEVRTMRAASLRWGHAYVGGRLRESIRSFGPKVSGGQASAWVTAGNEKVRYAKYQEFGTRHNAAHPFLRPALAESQSEIVSRIAAAVKDASRTGATSAEIEIEVRL